MGPIILQNCSLWLVVLVISSYAKFYVVTFCPICFVKMFLWKQTTDVKAHLIIKLFTCMALLSLQSIKIPILLIDTGSFYYTYAFTFNTSFITLMNDKLKGKTKAIHVNNLIIRCALTSVVCFHRNYRSQIRFSKCCNKNTTFIVLLPEVTRKFWIASTWEITYITQWLSVLHTYSTWIYVYTYCDFLSYLHTVHESRYIYKSIETEIFSCKIR
jgi:hypothetical protein